MDRGEPASDGPMRGAPVTDVPRVDAAVTLRATGDACAIDAAGRAVCWPSGRPERASRLTGIAPVTAIELRRDEGVAVLKSGAVVTLRLDAPGLVAPETKVHTAALPGVTDAVDFASVAGVTCVVRRGGKLACLKEGFPGRIQIGGLPPPPPELVLVEVEGISDAVRIVRGGDVLCATRKSGEVRCFRWYDVPAVAEAVARSEAPGPLHRPRGKVPTRSVHGHVIDPGIFELLDAPFCRQSLPVTAQALRVTGHRGMHVKQGAISIEDKRIELLFSHGTPAVERPRSAPRPRGSPNSWFRFWCGMVKV